MQQSARFIAAGRPSSAPRAVLAPRLYLKRPSSPSVYSLALAHFASPSSLSAAVRGRRRHCRPTELMPTAFLAAPRLPSSSHEPQNPRRRLLLWPSPSPASPRRRSARPPEPPPPWTPVHVARPTWPASGRAGLPSGFARHLSSFPATPPALTSLSGREPRAPDDPSVHSRQRTSRGEFD
jgi:hypothetical protein